MCFFHSISFTHILKWPTQSSRVMMSFDRSLQRQNLPEKRSSPRIAKTKKNARSRTVR